MPNTATVAAPAAVEQSASALAESYFKNGFVIIPGVLTPEQVAEMRASLRPKFDRPEQERPVGDTHQYLFDPFSRHPETRPVILNKRVVDVVTAILGGDRPALVREFAAQFRNYSGWHKDTSCLERAGLSYHWDKDFSFMTFTVYLQDNDPEIGGGLDVAPGSETWPDRYVAAKPKVEAKQSFWDKLLGKKPQAVQNDYGYDVSDISDFYSIPSKAGDMVIFNRKIDHRASVNKTGADTEKMGIFGSFSRQDRHLEAYHSFIGHRADYHYLRTLNYPAELVSEARALGLDLI
ncbi:MAG: phytanoyl-CoA dioxygenase family protein [Cyanobacteria bacterium SZAS LIN-3]|nr:phytanoyl-CoA dioxygenase family protein [Cyanobacteria bacterium SZAS LIN-3]